MTEPGWYQADGDPPGTTRYWDGSQWVGEPVPTPVASPVGPGVPGAPGMALASPGSRIGARFLDILVGFAIILLFLTPAISDMIDGFQALPDNPTDAQIEAVFEDAFSGRETSILLSAVVAWAIEAVLLALKGATIGKLMVGLRVVDEATGVTPLGWPKAIMRTLNRVIGLVIGFAGSQAIGNALSGILLLVGLISLIMLFSDDRNRTIMDRVASTVVVRK